MVNEIPASAFEAAVAFNFRPEAGSETYKFFEVNCLSAKQLHSIGIMCIRNWTIKNEVFLNPELSEKAE